MVNNRIVEIVQDEWHTEHPNTYQSDRDRYWLNYYRQQIKQIVLNDRKTAIKTLYDNWRSEIPVAVIHCVPTFEHLKSTLHRVRRAQLGRLPDRATDEFGMPGSDFDLNYYGATHGSEHRMSQRYHYQLQTDRRVHVWHSPAQNDICKGMDQLYIDGTFSIAPFINNGKRPWAEVFNVMVGKRGAHGATFTYKS